MRMLSRAAVSSLVVLGVALAVVVAAVAAIGILGVRAATGQGNEIAGDELAAAVVTGQLARSMDAAYAAGLAAVQASGPAERARLLGSLYANLLPAVDGRLFTLDRLHADDPPAEHADIVRFARQWAAVRTLLSPAGLPPAPALAAYAPVSAHLGRLFQRELDDARTDHAAADAGAVRAIGLIGGAAALGLALGAVLANVGATLRNVLRARDFAGRNGGEEFAVLLPDTSITEALEIAERVRVAVAELSLPGSDVSVTASVGVAVFPDHASTPDRLERLADAALYLAKRQGRNRVELADPSPAPAVSTANGAAPLTEAAPR